MVQFDREKVNQKILFMQGNLLKLNKLKALSKDEFSNDFRNCDSAKYLLQVTIEAMLDIASHLIARNRWGKPEDNKEHFKVLADNGIIDNVHIVSFFNMAKFRNRIVHMYFEVNDEMIYDIVQNNLHDFEAFIASIVKSLGR